MRRSRDEQDRIALRLPAEMKLEAERLARLSGERNVSDYYRKAIESHNERISARFEEAEPEEAGSDEVPLSHAPGPFRHLRAGSQVGHS